MSIPPRRPGFGDVYKPPQRSGFGDVYKPPQLTASLDREVLVRAENVSARNRHGTVILGEISLDLCAGEVVRIAGPNGSGKSTLLRILALRHLSARRRIIVTGRMTLLGQDTSQLRRDQETKLLANIHYLHQQDFGQGDKSAIDNTIDWLLSVEMLDKAKAVQRGEEALAEVGIPRTRFNESPVNFNVGHRARIAVASVLANRRRICLLDEILAALDQTTTVAMMQLLRELARTQNVAIAIAAPQELSPETEEFFDRTIPIMRPGKPGG